MDMLVTWIGQTDLDAASEKPDAGLGPVGQAVTQREFDRLVLLSNYSKEKTAVFVPWVETKTSAEIDLSLVDLSRPTHFGEIYEAVTAKLRSILQQFGDEARLTFHLSPGTPAMAAVWIIVAKTRYGAELIESSKKGGVQTAEIPFEISAEFIPDVYRRADRELVRLGAGISDEAPEFSDMIHQSPVMREVINRSRSVAPRLVPVLIEGESGTGKERLARAIHRASPRRDKPFKPVNCGAVSRELAESEFFGHRKGAFTGAIADRSGYFQDADGGTLFLDEIGELSPDLQVKLLRVLEEGKVTPVGTTAEKAVDVRIIAATNRNLAEEASNGRFRSDLFFRVAVALIRLPPLRDRRGDFMPLVDHLLDRFNRESASDPAWQAKTIAPSAIARLARHSWPGNIRELANTLARAALWSADATITEADVEDALLDLPSPENEQETLLGLAVENGIDLPDLMRQLATHYLRRAIAVSGGNKTRAAELLSLPSYQTLNNWLKKYGMAGG